MWAEHNMHLDEAEEMIGRALQLDPNNGAYLDSLGWVHYRKASTKRPCPNYCARRKISPATIRSSSNTLAIPIQN